MEETDTYVILADTLWVVLLASAPVLVLALGVGLAIAFFQALTQIQEMTLTFVPKIVVILIGLIASLPLMYATLSGLSDKVFDLIGSGSV